MPPQALPEDVGGGPAEGDPHLGHGLREGASRPGWRKAPPPSATSRSPGAARGTSPQTTPPPPLAPPGNPGTARAPRHLPRGGVRRARGAPSCPAPPPRRAPWEGPSPAGPRSAGGGSGRRPAGPPSPRRSSPRPATPKRSPMVICTLLTRSRFHSGSREGVGEAEVEQVLHRLLAQVVVDAEDGLFGELPAQDGVQLPRRAQVAPEGLLHHDPCPAEDPGPCQPLHHRGEHRGLDGQVEEWLLGAVQGLRQAPERLRAAGSRPPRSAAAPPAGRTIPCPRRPAPPGSSACAG